MKSVLILIGLLLAVAGGSPPAGANGCPLPCSGQVASPPDERLLFVQPEGERGEVLAYDTKTGRRAFSLPPGISSADGRWHVVARASRSRTRFFRFRLATATGTSVVSAHGRWDVAGVSPSGRWIAATRAGSRTTIAILDASRRRVAHVLRLRGDFEVETISADGRRLFLVEHLRAGRYLVRLYDLSREQLIADPLRAKGEDKVMTGLAWSGVASPDGRWLLTLYLDTSRRHAFVHALDLDRSSPRCIDLPSGAGRLETLKQYVLTLSPDGRRLYAANAALGVVAEIDLRTRRVARTARFRGGPAEARAPVLGGTISRKGRTLYFSGGRDLWAYDAAFGVVRGPYATGGRLLGYGFGRDDRRVYALRADGRMLVFDAATGRKLTA